jgi:hypothetical protein
MDRRIEWLRAYVAKHRSPLPYAPNVKSALMDMLDEGLTVPALSLLTGCPQRTIYGFCDSQRRASADLRRAERGRAEDRAARDKALAERDARLRLMPMSSIEVDLLGSPPPGRSALDQRIARKADAAE